MAATESLACGPGRPGWPGWGGLATQAIAAFRLFIGVCVCWGGSRTPAWACKAGTHPCGVNVSSSGRSPLIRWHLEVRWLATRTRLTARTGRGVRVTHSAPGIPVGGRGRSETATSPRRAPSPKAATRRLQEAIQPRRRARAGRFARIGGDGPYRPPHKILRGQLGFERILCPSNSRGFCCGCALLIHADFAAEDVFCAAAPSVSPCGARAASLPMGWQAFRPTPPPTPWESGPDGRVHGLMARRRSANGL
jgi:hypothetical protein